MKLDFKPDAIIINVPEAFFKHKGKIVGDRETHFRNFYEAMGTEKCPDGCFYHFISCVPRIEVLHAYVAFRGKIQYRAIVVKYLRNQPVHIEDYDHDEPRDWLVTTGPVVKAPRDFPMKGFRGFRYSEKIF